MSITTKFQCQKQFFFQTFQFSINAQFSSIWPINRTLLGVTTQSLGGPGSDGNKRIIHIPKRSRITGTSPSDCLVSYLGHWLRKSYPSAEIYSVYSPAPAGWAWKFIRTLWKNTNTKEWYLQHYQAEMKGKVRKEYFEEPEKFLKPNSSLEEIKSQE